MIYDIIIYNILIYKNIIIRYISYYYEHMIYTIMSDIIVISNKNTIRNVIWLLQQYNDNTISNIHNNSNI